MWVELGNLKDSSPSLAYSALFTSSFIYLILYKNPGALGTHEEKY